MPHQKVVFLTTHGVATEISPESESVFFLRDGLGTWLPSKGNYMFDAERICVEIHDGFEERLFGSRQNYWDFLRVSPQFLSVGGMNSEAPISKDLFGQMLEKIPSGLPVNKALYLYDYRKLVSNIQECSKEVIQLQGEFYQALNLEELFAPGVPEDDGVRWGTSPTVTKIFALLGFIYIRLHSLLDYTTKLAIEIENLKTGFEEYPRLASKNCLYSSRKRISINGRQGTLFEACSEITEVETVRNHIIHDGLLDDMPKAYKAVENGVCVEKYLLFPDRSVEGRFDAYKNRNLFYGGEDKINLRLPDLISGFQLRLVNSLTLLRDILVANSNV